MEPIATENNIEDLESDDNYVGRTLCDENKRTTHITHIRWRKGFEICTSTITKSRTYQKIIWRQFVCNKEGHRTRDKKQVRLAFHEILDVTVRQELKRVINNTTE